MLVWVAEHRAVPDSWNVYGGLGEADADSANYHLAVTN